jgi:Subtilase family
MSCAKHRKAIVRAILAVFGCLVLGTSSFADDQTDQQQAKSDASLVLVFEGGNVATNMTAVIGRLIEKHINLPSQVTTVDVDETNVCELLAGQGYPPPCTPLIGMVKQLNPSFKGNLNRLTKGQQLIFPDVKLSLSRSQRSFVNTKPPSQDVDEVVKNWKLLNPTPLGNSQTEKHIEYDAYTMEVPFRQAADARLASQNVSLLQLPNVTVDVHAAGAHSIRLFSPKDFAPDLVQQACSDNSLWQKKLHYLELDDVDQDAKRRLADPPAGALHSTIYIIDVPLSPAPNLYPAFGEAPPPNTPGSTHCLWKTFVASVHHSTLLASIIASHANWTGFDGIWPDVRLRSFDVVANSDNLPTRISSLIATTTGPRQIYLFALTIGETDNFATVAGSHGITAFANSRVRLSSPLATTIMNRSPLIIAAAGQADGEHPLIRDINPTTTFFPQNLGDQPNVIVVTACTDCARDSPKLMPTAYVSSDSWKFVHIAAPGGAPGGQAVVGWTSESSIGAAGAGTSQAAAHVGAIAASMIERYPTSYLAPGQMKYRLQVCSYPLPSALPDSEPNSDTKSLAAGIIDPLVCYLNPDVNWIKRGNGWEPISLRGFGTGTLFTGPNGHPASILNDAILRIVKRRGASDWTVYSDRTFDDDATDQMVGGLGQVRLTYSLKPTRAAVIIPCQGEPIAISDLEDFILSNNSDTHGDNSCQNLPVVSGTIPVVSGTNGSN